MRILVQVNDLLRECSQEKPVREQGKQDRQGDRASKEVAPDVYPQPDPRRSSWTCKVLATWSCTDRGWAIILSVALYSTLIG